jgi:hypothetical protein
MTKTPKIINLQRGKIYFGSWLQRLQFMAGGFHCFWAYGEAEHHSKEHMVEETAHLMVMGKQRERG